MSPGGHMAVALVVMESPAIIMAVLLANMLRHTQAKGVTISSSGGAAVTMGGSGYSGPSLGKIIHDLFR